MCSCSELAYGWFGIVMLLKKKQLIEKSRISNVFGKTKKKCFFFLN